MNKLSLVAAIASVLDVAGASGCRISVNDSRCDRRAALGCLILMTTNEVVPFRTLRLSLDIAASRMPWYPVPVVVFVRDVKGNAKAIVSALDQSVNEMRKRACS